MPRCFKAHKIYSFQNAQVLAVTHPFAGCDKGRAGDIQTKLPPICVPRKHLAGGFSASGLAAGHLCLGLWFKEPVSNRWEKARSSSYTWRHLTTAKHSDDGRPLNAPCPRKCPLTEERREQRGNSDTAAPAESTSSRISYRDTGNYQLWDVGG